MVKSLLRALCALGAVLLSVSPVNTDQGRATDGAHPDPDPLASSPMQGQSPGAAWTSGGPFGGYITCLAVAPSNASVIYAGTEGGVYKTTDGGATWTRAGIIYKQYSASVISTEFADLLTLQVAPHNPDIVYAGSTTGVYISQNGGVDWTNTWPGIDVQVNAIAVSPSNPAHVLIATGDTPSPSSTEVIGIHKSTDGGTTWHTKLDRKPPGQDELESVEAVLFDTNNAQVVYAGVVVDSGSQGGLRKSTDGGETWNPIKVNTTEDVYALTMTPSGHNPATIYAYAENFSNEDIYASEDQGATWNPLAKPADAVGNPFFYSTFLKVDPGNAAILYASGPDSLYRYTRTTGDWAEIAVGQFALRPSCMAIRPSSSHLFVGVTRAGVFRSTDAGSQWTLAPMVNTHINDLAVHPGNPAIAYAAVEGIGFNLSKTVNTGSKWDQLPNSETYLGAVAIDHQNPSTLYVGEDYRTSKYSASIYRSANNGQDWQKIVFLRCSGAPCEYGTTQILVSATNSNHILVGGIGDEGMVARTTDGGMNWDQIAIHTTALAQDPNDPNIVYRGRMTSGGVFRYDDVWGSWSRTTITPSGGIGSVRAIALDQASQVYVAASDGLWRWDGAHWTHFTNLPTDDLTAVAVDRIAAPNVVYAGTDGMGVFSSSDGGATWTALNAGLGNLYITELQVGAGQPRVLYAGTSYGGVWTLPLSTLPANLDERLCLPLLWRSP